MKHSRFIVHFKTNFVEHEYAFGVEEAIILAQAEQIRRGNDYAVAFVERLHEDTDT